MALLPYLDYAASTPTDPRVMAKMAQFSGPEGIFANPSSAHPAGQAAAQAVATAKQQVLNAVGANAYALTWTSGATEADNLAILGRALALAKRQHQQRRILVCATEHSAVLEAAYAAQSHGFVVEHIGVQPDGLINTAELVATLDVDVALVSVAHMNNETGVIQDLSEIAQATHAVGALLHVDAAQSAGRLSFDADALEIDLISLSAHKFYGPKGIGGLCHAPHVRLAPLIHGGGQQNGLRSGTLPVALIVGMGEAFRQRDEPAEQARQQALKDSLYAQLASLGGVVLNGRKEGSAHILNVSFAGVHGAALRAALTDLAVGFGSACSTKHGPSHVLRAMQRPDPLAHASVRISIGRFTEADELELAGEFIADAVRKLRAISPIWREYRQGAALETVYSVTTPLELA
ncbi:MAG: aminotransferase class V-fold PLP-dependent enzyme [Spiribacter sp.]|jgi:cysteine desulfurase|nr:aminotransferase class V-fold PLP-dependent enzyme [Spiribacter sp.]MDR9490065.1 aminotransferase class V-fold PLP-dependent enzyme [Spiribacter sp.]